MTDEDARRGNGSTRQGSDDPGDGIAEPDLRASRHVMRLLGAHIPISLFLDMSARAPDSEHLLAAEGDADKPWWEPAPATPPPPRSPAPPPA